MGDVGDVNSTGDVACVTKATVPGGVVIDSFDMAPAESCMGDVASWEPIISRGDVTGMGDVP